MVRDNYFLERHSCTGTVSWGLDEVDAVASSAKHALGTPSKGLTGRFTVVNIAHIRGPLKIVIPAKAGIYRPLKTLDPRLRGDDEKWIIRGPRKTPAAEYE